MAPRKPEDRSFERLEAVVKGLQELPPGTEVTMTAHDFLALLLARQRQLRPATSDWIGLSEAARMLGKTEKRAAADGRRWVKAKNPMVRARETADGALEFYRPDCLQRRQQETEFHNMLREAAKEVRPPGGA